MKQYKNKIVVGIDHGYGNIKTASHIFKAGVLKSETEPVFQTNMLIFGGKYYLIGEGHKEFTADKITDEEYFILESLDGTKSLETIKEEFEAKFPPQKITLEEIQNFVGQLHQCSLIVVGVPDQGHELLKRRKKRRRKEILAACSNILAIRFKGVDPDRFFNKLLPYVRWCFHPVTLACCLLLMASAALLIGIEFDHFTMRPISPCETSRSSMRRHPQVFPPCPSAMQFSWEAAAASSAPFWRRWIANSKAEAVLW